MKKHTYRFGHWSLKTYFKPVGHGYECGFTWNGKTFFVGNFIHKSEATRWYSIMTREVRSFTRKYYATTRTTPAFYQKFITNHLYTKYYAFLDKLFTKYNRSYKTAFTRTERTYFKMKRSWKTTDKRFVAKVA